MYFEINWNRFVKSHKGFFCSPFFLNYIFFFNSLFASVQTQAQISWAQAENHGEAEVKLSSFHENWVRDDFILLKSQSGQIVGLFEVEDPSQKTLRLLSMSSDRLPQRTDYFGEAFLNSPVENLEGTAVIWKYENLSRQTLARYKPLYTQGTTIGDTAQTLYKGEILLTAFGNFSYGAHRAVTFSTNIPAIAFGSANARLKARAYRGKNQTWAVGVSLAQDQKSSEKLMNIDIIWDSILSENLIAHSILSAAVISFDSAKDVAALKSYGSSSIQTGYEYIFSDWSRILMGPSYNVEQKAIGGYVGYIKIFDNFHFQLSLTTNNILELKMSAEEGYLAFIDAYWRW